jgi:hypothetical protein
MRFPRAVWAGIVVLLATFALQAGIAARRDSVTVDEFVHLPLGLYNLYTGDFSDDPINPPLSRMIAALPLLFDPPAFHAEADDAHWTMGYRFMAANADRYQDIYVRARTMVILVALVLGLVVFRWAYELAGWQAGLAALGLFAFTPELLAHGHLVTLDLCGALGFTTTCYATWRWLGRPTPMASVVTGAALGLATLLKLSGFVLVGAVASCVVAHLITGGSSARRGGLRSWAGLLALVGLSALGMINLGYGFDGFMAPLADAALDREGPLHGAAVAAPWLRLPLPRPFIEGVDMVMNVGQQPDPAFFFAGELSARGWWYYHLAAFALKAPIPFVALSVLSVGCWLLGRGYGARSFCLFLPVLVIFVSNALVNSLQIGVRHVLPVFPLLIVAGAPLVSAAFASRSRPGWQRLPAIVAGVGALWLVGGTVAVAPRYLQYFNEVAGGPEGGHRMLVDSNVDWGQDLIRLREYMDAEGLDRINLAYFGRVDPRVYRISFAPLEPGRSLGPTAVSATFLMGRPYFWFLGGGMRWVKPGTYTWLQRATPVARVGAMFVYDLDATMQPGSAAGG